VLYRYSLRQAIEDNYVKSVQYVAKADDLRDKGQKWQLIANRHNEKVNELKGLGILPITIIVAQKTRSCDAIAADFKDFLKDSQGLSDEQGEKPTVQFYEGKAGLLSTHEDIYLNKFGDEPVYMVYSRDLVGNLFTQKEGETMKMRRLSKGIKSKVVYTSEHDTKPSDETGDRLKIDFSKYPINTDIAIYGDQIKISIFGKRLSGISIKSKELATTLKSLINYIFDNQK
jgi:hypothetical protein